MAKKIKLFSKLPDEEQILINSLIKNSELKVIYINAQADSKKGVILTSKGDETLIIFDVYTKHTVKEDDDDDDDDDDNDEDDDDEMEDLNDDVDLEEDEEKLK